MSLSDFQEDLVALTPVGQVLYSDRPFHYHVYTGSIAGDSKQSPGVLSVRDKGG